ncbi:MAG: lysine--tRNA ligase, partial [Thermoplasmata archaeon]|nr:lysine--tRNA ligase [Thermoplasmata archaeon]
MHWFDELYPSVEAHVAEIDSVVCNAGISVSGLMHVGSLRGEIVLNHFIASRLRAAGRNVTQHLTLYTQDRWKGTPRQLAQFPDDGGRPYVGHRMIEVPDPQACHPNWVDHFWEGFADSLDRFAPGVEVSRTTDLYRTEAMQALVHEVADRADEVREVVNQYRPRNPQPEGWIPFEPLCLTCRKMGDARALGFHDGEVQYECACGGSGSSPLELGKLNWRVEWPVLWALLKVAVEPFGKDHAAPGGSRETSRVIAERILGIAAPLGIPYEWVGYAEDGTDRGDMSSSRFLGFDPSTWLRVGDPEVLRFLFAATPIRRRLVLDLSQVDAHHQRYDQAETASYEGSTEDPARAYQLGQLEKPPEHRPFQLAFRHASLLAQVAPDEEALAWSLGRLAATGILQGELGTWERGRIARRLLQARAWVEDYGPDEMRIEVQKTLSPEVDASLSDADRESLQKLARTLSHTSWQEVAIREAMVTLTSGGELDVSTSRFFEALYLTFLGQPLGP